MGKINKKISTIEPQNDREIPISFDEKAEMFEKLSIEFSEKAQEFRESIRELRKDLSG